MSAAFAKYLAVALLISGGALAAVSLGVAWGSMQPPVPRVPWPAGPPAPPVTIIPIPNAPPATARFRLPQPPLSGQVLKAQPAIARVPAPTSYDPAVVALRAALIREVPGLLTLSAERRQVLLARAQAALGASDISFIEHPQVVLVVDRSPRAQELWVVIAKPNDAAWEVLGGTRVSTGTTGRFDHYITPTGVFQNTAEILGYRAEGTFNANHIRGNGVKGMRVWDFGWQWAEKGWRADHERGQIRLEMHATDPANLAHLFGQTASSGCIRIPDALNRFLDRHGLIDADYERAAADDIRFRALLLPDRAPTPLAGDTVIVVDTDQR